MGKNLSAALGWCGRAIAAGAMLVGLGVKPAEATVFFQWTQISGTIDEPYSDGTLPLLTGWVAMSDWAFKSGISAYSEKENETYDSMAPDWQSVGLEGIYFAVDDFYGGTMHVTLSSLFNQRWNPEDGGTPLGWESMFQWTTWQFDIQSKPSGTPDIYFWYNNGEQEFWWYLSEGPSQARFAADWAPCSEGERCNFVGIFRRVSVPEPASSGLLIAGLVALWGTARRRRVREA